VVELAGRCWLVRLECDVAAPKHKQPRPSTPCTNRSRLSGLPDCFACLLASSQRALGQEGRDVPCWSLGVARLYWFWRSMNGLATKLLGCIVVCYFEKHLKTSSLVIPWTPPVDLAYLHHHNHLVTRLIVSSPFWPVIITMLYGMITCHNRLNEALVLGTYTTAMLMPGCRCDEASKTGCGCWRRTLTYRIAGQPSPSPFVSVSLTIS
jgi:hypothetical protein